MPIFTTRHAPAEVIARLIAQGEKALLARLHAARGVASVEEVRTDLAALALPHRMLNLGTMALRVADAIAAEAVVIVADYDADGATACAVGLRALRAFGLSRSLVPGGSALWPYP
jgi:single-stranded-DNA-specific exonuclease